MSYEAAAAILRETKHLLISAGAGMGVDSGLPDFRGNAGFWQAYPPYQKLALSFVDLANPFSLIGTPNKAGAFMAIAWSSTATPNPTAASRSSGVGPG